jgi:hypothetical protein
MRPVAVNDRSRGSERETANDGFRARGVSGIESSQARRAAYFIRNSPARCRLRSETIDYVIRGRVAREMSRLSPTRPRADAAEGACRGSAKLRQLRTSTRSGSAPVLCAPPNRAIQVDHASGRKANGPSRACNGYVEKRPVRRQDAATRDWIHSAPCRWLQRSRSSFAGSARGSWACTRRSSRPGPRPV